MQVGAKNSWFTPAFDGTDFGPGNPIQLKPLEYEHHEDEGPWGILNIMDNFCVVCCNWGMTHQCLGNPNLISLLKKNENQTPQPEKSLNPEWTNLGVGGKGLQHFAFHI